MAPQASKKRLMHLGNVCIFGWDMTVIMHICPDWQRINDFVVFINELHEK